MCAVTLGGRGVSLRHNAHIHVGGAVWRTLRVQLIRCDNDGQAKFSSD